MDISAESSRVLCRKGSVPGRKVHCPKRKRGPKWSAFSELEVVRNGSARSARTCTATAARTAIAARTGAESRLRLHRQQAFTLQLLARQLAGAAYGLGLFAGLL